ncbi:hypothetical protein MSSAC_1003 [Methanosarcina siciliae C2J]|uniref:Uncharacterized protein n=1 Tax=Methanosarcina siciliae C2J TaxID=1434118 RepID=A0A0E3PKL2_9EURY|nr:hypothetical protein [Methanosarcina siciliae]AKB35593.1 hypothetical protein MSSAC_1003 [Methanosarcina siciliae C2J]
MNTIEKKMNALMDLRGYNIVKVNEKEAIWPVLTGWNLEIDVSFPSDLWVMKHDNKTYDWKKPETPANIGNMVQVLVDDYLAALAKLAFGEESAPEEKPVEKPAKSQFKNSARPRKEPKKEPHPPQNPSTSDPEKAEPPKQELQEEVKPPIEADVQPAIKPEPSQLQIIKNVTQDRVEIIRNSKGYNWEISVHDDDVFRAIDRAIIADQRLRTQFRGENDA